MQLGTHSTPQWNSKPKFLKREHKRFCIFLHQIATMQAYHNVFILCTSKSADTISLELSNIMELVFLRRGTKVVSVTVASLPRENSRGTTWERNERYYM